MALTVAQEQTLYRVLRENFPQDNGEQFAQRVIQFMVRNSPSAAQKSAIAPLISASLATRDATLSTYDANAATAKTSLQTDRAAVNALTGSL